MSVPITRATPTDEEVSTGTRTVVWMLYWVCVAVGVLLMGGLAVLVAADGGRSSRGEFSGTVFTLMGMSLPFVWLVVGPPPGYSALSHYRRRFDPLSRSEQSTAPSPLRTGFELLSAAAIAYSVFGTILLSGARLSIGVSFWEDGLLLKELLAGPLDFVVSNTGLFFALAAVGLLYGAFSWFVLWITR